MLILLLPIRANSTPYPFQDMISSHSVHSRELAHPLGRLSIKAPESPRQAVGLLSKLGQLDSPFQTSKLERYHKCGDVLELTHAFMLPNPTAMVPALKTPERPWFLIILALGQWWPKQD